MQQLGDLAGVRQGLVRVGRGAGRRSGDWVLRIVESRHVRDGHLDSDDLEEIGVVRNVRTERHLLRPFDVLVTARAGRAECALVPADVWRTVAGVTMLVVRPDHTQSGLGHYLWYFLNSTQGRSRLARRMTTTATLKSLTAKNLAQVEVPVPSPSQLDTVARLVEASEAAYKSEVEAARLRREVLRDSIIHDIGRTAVSATQED
ncbi:MAG: hypothetical protein OXG52_07645 [bacterium]|nr:hypothetical protein [bacterium]